MNDKKFFPDGNTNRNPDVIKLMNVIYVSMPEIMSMRRLMHAILISNGVQSTRRESMHQMVAKVARFLPVNTVDMPVIDDFWHAHFERDKYAHNAIRFLRGFSKSAGIRLQLPKCSTPNQTSDVANRTIFDYAKPWAG